MDEPISEKPKRVSFSCCGCFSILAIIALAAVIFYVYSSTQQSPLLASFNNMVDTVQQTPPSKSLSSEDAEVLTVWMYFTIESGRCIDEVLATDINSPERSRAELRWGDLLAIKHTLPTNAKYKDYTDAIQIATKERADLIVKLDNGENEDDIPVDSKNNQKLFSSAKRFAADIRYTTDVLPKDERDRILARYYSSWHESLY